MSTIFHFELWVRFQRQSREDLCHLTRIFGAIFSNIHNYGLSVSQECFQIFPEEIGLMLSFVMLLFRSKIKFRSFLQEKCEIFLGNRQTNDNIFPGLIYFVFLWALTAFSPNLGAKMLRKAKKSCETADFAKFRRRLRQDRPQN